MNEPTGKDLRWLIVEDALRDRKGHWFEYISTFVRGLRELGDVVTVLADCEAEPFILEGLRAQPALPASIWHRMNDKASPLRRYARVPDHAWRTVRAVKKHLASAGGYDIIFVPTVLVHHLLGWTWLIKRAALGGAKVVLFFPNAPVTCSTPDGEASWNGSPTTRLMRYLLKSLTKEVQGGKAMLGAETRPMQEALTRLSGVPFTYLPHPVNGLPKAKNAPSWGLATEAGRERVPASFATESIDYGGKPAELVLGSYGPARHEKGSDTLFQAVDLFCRRGGGRCRFVLQCLEGFEAERRALEGNCHVDWLTSYFGAGEYESQLSKTDIMLLPYRLSSYRLRVSRVAVEAIVNGIPILATRGSTLASQAEEFGAAVVCEENDPASVAAAIQQALHDQDSLAERAAANVGKAREHFSVRNFRNILLAAGAPGETSRTARSL